MSVLFLEAQTEYLQAESSEENHDANMEEVGDAQGKAEEYTYHSGPTVVQVSARSGSGGHSGQAQH